jgi:hypothetical protein
MEDVQKKIPYYGMGFDQIRNLHSFANVCGNEPVLKEAHWGNQSELLHATGVLIIIVLSPLSTKDSSDRLRRCFRMSKPHIKRIGLPERPLS